MKTCIKNVRMIDGKGGAIEKGYIVFDEQKIINVAEGDSQTDSDIVVDGTGMTVLPGMIDCHVHLGLDCSPDPFAQAIKDTEAGTAFKVCQQGRQFLEAGVTTVRSLGTRFNVDISYRNAISEGTITGPRVYASGYLIAMTGGHGNAIGIEADGVNEVRKTARSQLKAGADVLKIMSTGGILTKGSRLGAAEFEEEEIRAVCIEAEKKGKKTSTHAIGLDGTKNALRAGISSIEHGHFIDDEAIELMLRNGTFLVPTLKAGIFIAKQPAGTIPQFMMGRLQEMNELQRVSFRKALKAGVKTALGTDAGCPNNYHGHVVDEMKLRMEDGMTPLQVIACATNMGAQCLGIHQEVGSLETGKLADIILVKGNPLDDIDHLKNIVQVYKEGRLSVNNFTR